MQTITKSWYQKFTNEILRFLSTIAEFFYHPVIIFLGLIGCLYFQVNHLAEFVQRNSAYDSPAIAYPFAIVVEITALVHTIHGGKETTIRNFALLTFFTNILFYEVWTGIAPTSDYFAAFISKVTISAIIAYCLYSYSELFFKQAKEAKEEQLKAERLERERLEMAEQKRLESEQARIERERLKQDQKEREAKEQEELAKIEREKQEHANRLIEVDNNSTESDIKNAIKIAKNRIGSAKYRLEKGEGNPETSKVNITKWTKELSRLERLLHK